MSVFRCKRCECMIDADYEGCNEHPFDENECVCDNCYVVFNCFECGEISKDMVHMIDKSPLPMWEKYVCRGCI
jgi:hypothetical protein